MIEAVYHGLLLVLSWPAFGYLIAGVLIGLYFGAVPGLSGLVGMAIILPFTYNLDPIGAFALLLGMNAVTSTSDTLASVLLGVPGTAASQATILDGYPMAKKGQAARAFGAAFTVSAVGGVLGGVFLALSIPVVRPLILSFASPEFFLLGLLGLTMVGSLSGDSLTRGLAVAALGVLLSTVGLAPQTGVPRFTFGITYLLEGFPLIPAVLGLFAIPEIIFLAMRDSSISGRFEQSEEGGLLEGVKDAARHWWLTIRCSVIGTYIGMLPGLGASIVDWAAYGHAVQTERNPGTFGTGDVRGVIAPEAANNASKAGALIPTIAFGIPGGASMAVLLGAFLIHGLTPGRAMLTRNLDFTFSLVWMLIIANVVGSLLLMMWARQIAKLTFIRAQLIIPGIVLFVMMGAWMTNNVMADWWTLFAFGALGLCLRLAGWPRAPLVLGFILGPIMENSLDITLQRYGLDWVTRPLSAILMVLIALTLVLTGVRYMRRKRLVRSGAETAIRSDVDDGHVGPRPLGIPLAMICIACTGWAVWAASGLSYAGALFPLTFAVPCLLLLLAVLGQELVGNIRSARALGVSPALHWLDQIQPGETAVGIGGMVLWFGVLVIATYAVGQPYALPVFVLAYLLVAARASWLFSLIYTAGAVLVIWGMFDRLVRVVWHPGWFL